MIFGGSTTGWLGPEFIRVLVRMLEGCRCEEIYDDGVELG